MKLPYNSIRFIAIAATLLATILSSVSILIYPSEYTPVIVFGAIAGIWFIYICYRKPIWALFATLLVIFLPQYLISPHINSMLNRVLTIVAASFWLFNMIMQRKKIIITTPTWIFGGFILWGAVSLYWTDHLDAGTTYLQIYILRFILFFILLINEIRTRKDLDQLINILALSGGLLASVGIYTVLSQGYVSGDRLQVLGVNANALGMTLLIMMPSVIYWSIRPSPRIYGVKKGLAIVYLIATIILIAMSGSKGSAISFGITVLAFFIWKPTRQWGIIAIAILGLAAALTPFIFTTTIARFLGMTGDSLLTGREYLWLAGLKLIRDNVLLGVGIGAVRYEVIPYLLQVGGRGADALIEGVVLHNPILVIWGDLGIPGITLYLGALVGALLSFVRQYLYCKRLGINTFFPYFSLIASAFLGYIFSWTKGGGIEADYSYFLVLSLLIIPSCLDMSTFLHLRA